MRIAVVSPYDLSVHGGVQHQCHGLARHLRGAGHDVLLVGPSAGPDDVSVGRSSQFSINGSRAPVAIGFGVARRVRSVVNGVDVVHVHEPFVPAVSLAVLSMDVPLVATFHADPGPAIRRAYRLFGPLVKRKLSRAVVTAVSPISASAVAPWVTVEAVVPNGLDVPDTVPTDDARRPNSVVFVGRDEPRKGLDVLLGAWPRVMEEVPGASLTVINATRRPEPGVEFAGRVDEETKTRILASTKVAVAPNLGGESFGIVVVEAMASGCAVIASSLPAFRHVTQGSALLVSPGDVPGLAAAIIELLEDHRKRSHLSVTGRGVAGGYAWPRIVAEYTRLYDQARESA